MQLATRRVYISKGVKKVDTQFHNIVTWNKATPLLHGLVIGQRIRVFGRLQTRTWEDRDTGVKQERTEIVADRIIRHH